MKQPATVNASGLLLETVAIHNGSEWVTFVDKPWDLERNQSLTYSAETVIRTTVTAEYQPPVSTEPRMHEGSCSECGRYWVQWFAPGPPLSFPRMQCSRCYELEQMELRADFHYQPTRGGGSSTSQNSHAVNQALKGLSK